MTVSRPQLPVRLAGSAVALALLVMVFGAYVRISDAGLACPDWPGCYGRLVPPGAADAPLAQAAYPDIPLDRARAWKEMVHRYLAASLGLLILALTISVMRERARPARLVLPASLLCLLVVGQAWLGRLTVTSALQPLTVTAHLLGGALILLLLWWCFLSLAELRAGAGAGNTPPVPGQHDPKPPGRGLQAAARVALCALFIQFALGGWTSSNYAGLACPDFPTCGGEWWPDHLDFRAAFSFQSRAASAGAPSPAALEAIQIAHRLGGLLLLLLIGSSAAYAWRCGSPRLRPAALLLAAALCAQFGLGILAVLLRLPTVPATAHNAGAALLLLALGLFLHRLRPHRGGPGARAPHNPALGS